MICQREKTPCAKLQSFCLVPWPSLRPAFNLRLPPMAAVAACTTTDTAAFHTAAEPITQSLRDLVEAALHNGCEDLKITSGSGLESLLLPPCPIPPILGYPDQKKNIPPSKRLRRYFGQFFTKKKEMTETGTVSSLGESFFFFFLQHIIDHMRYQKSHRRRHLR